MTAWRDLLSGDRARDVARLDAALGHRLQGLGYVDALLDPRGRLFQRLEYVGDALLDVVVVRALVALEPWTERSLALLSVEQKELVSDHALGRVAARRGLPDVRTFPVSVHRLGDRIEACIGAVWADAGLEAAEQVADRLVLVPGLDGRLQPAVPPVAEPDERYAAAARRCGHEPLEPAWFGAAAAGGPPRRRLAAVGNAVLEAAFATSQYVEQPTASEAELSEARYAATSNLVLAQRSRDLHLVHGHDDPRDRRGLADEVQALVGAATMDGGLVAGFDVAGAVLDRLPQLGPVAFAS